MLTATIPGQTDTNISGVANQIAAHGIPLFLADSPWDEINSVIQGAEEMPYPEIKHLPLAVSDQVFNDARNALGWP
jgi:ABC-type uncharacterized transport system permease subunit